MGFCRVAQHMREIFLSASIPARGRKYFRGADPVLIHAAVRAFAMLVLGRRHIVWGGHPTITPMLWAACESLGVKYAKSVTLYQSQHFKDDFPRANENFRNVVYVPKKRSRAASLSQMREQMLARPEIEAAVFIGGMEGITHEFSLFRRLKPKKPYVLVSAGGGAARYLAEKRSEDKEFRSTNFIRLF